MPVIQTVRTVRGVKAVKIDSLWYKVDGLGKVWRESESDWFASSMPASDVIKAIEKEEIKILVRMGGSPPKKPDKNKTPVKTAAEKIKELFNGSDKSYALSDLQEICGCCRSVADDALRGLRKAKSIVQGKDTQTNNNGRPARTWHRRLINT